MIAAAPPGSDFTQPSAVEVQVSPEMVARFAVLTGDRSSLHVSEGFARRSAYRQPVVHGMLPVGCLALLPSLHIEGFRAIPLAVSGRFLGPVFPGDTLMLKAASGRPTDDAAGVAFDYQIARDRTVLTAGTLTVAYEAAPEVGSVRAVAAEHTLLAEPVALSHLLLEQIETGASDRLDFRIDEDAAHAFAALVALGAGEEGRERAQGIPRHVHAPNLLSMLLFSTSIGVSLPGASATFLEFSARVERRLEWNTAYTLRGRITHKSAATRILKKELLVTGNTADEVYVRGKAATLVAQPSSRMPTVDELRALGVDLGLDGKVVVITGASRGIGETTAKLFALHGARVVVNFHRGAADATRVVDEIVAGGGQAIAIAADVSQADEVRTLFDRAREQFGTVHVLVNNAARDYRPTPFLALSWNDVQKDLDVIVKGAFLCCQQAIPLMLAQGEGRIVNISTIATDDPPPDQAKYVVAKSALVGLTRSLSIEFAARNIQVNMVVPNFVETDLVAHIQDGFRKKIARDIPMQRAASPVDVARAVVFLASNYSSFTTGQKLMVTGGGAPYL